MAKRDTVEVVVKIRDAEAQRELKALRDKVSGLTDELEEMRKEQDRASSSTGKLTDALKGIGAAAAARELAQMVVHLADVTNEINDTARATSLASKTIAGLRLAAQGSGLELGNLTSSLTQLPKRIDDVRRGTGEALPGFRALGLEAKVVAGEISSADDVMRAVLQRLPLIEDKTQRAAIATQIFGEAGGQLLVALGDAPGALDQFSRKAEILGVDLDGASESASNLQRSIADIGTAAEGAGQRIISALGGDKISGILNSLAFGIARVGRAGEIFVENFGAQNLTLPGLTGGVVSALNQAQADIISEIQGPGVSSVPGFGVLKDPLGEGKIEVPKFLARPTGAAPAKKAPAKTGSTSNPIGFGSSIADLQFDAEQFAALSTPGVNIGLGNLRGTGSVSQSTVDVINAQQAQINAALAGQGFGNGSILGGIRGDALLETVGFGGGRALGALAQGNVAAAFGPAGGALSAIAGIGEQGAQGVQKQLNMFKEAFLQGLKELPEILSEVIPKFAIAIATELIPALIDNSDEIFKGLLDGLALIFREFLAEFAENLDPTKNLFGEARQGNIGNVLGNLATGPVGLINTLGRNVFRTPENSRARGGMIDRTGLYLMHAGERVSSNSGTMDGTTRNSMRGGGSRNIVVNGNVFGSMEGFVRDLDEYLGDGGPGNSRVIGG